VQSPDGPRRFESEGPFETVDGDMLTGWALDGRGMIVNERFGVAGRRALIAGRRTHAAQFLDTDEHAEGADVSMSRPGRLSGRD